MSYTHNTPLSLTSRPLGATSLRVPPLGLGTWRRFDLPAAEQHHAQCVVDTAVDVGVRLFDTAPVYGRSEEVLADALRPHPDALVATKVWDTDPQSARETFARQRQLFGRKRIDLLQVHNLNGWQANLEWMAREKHRGTLGYTGVTYQFDNAFGLGGTRDDLRAAMESGLVDTIQINLSAGEPTLADDVLPLATELGIGVLVMRPFGEGTLLRRAPTERTLAGWGCADWPEALLRWVLTYPQVSVALTATADPAHLRANARAAARGPLAPTVHDAVSRFAGADSRR